MHVFQDFHFKGQHENEKILQIIHRHWFNILIQYLVVVFAIILFVGSFFFILFYYPELLAILGYQMTFFLETTLFIFVWFYSFLIWIDYYFDVWIITNERIVNIEQKGLFVREISELQLSKIQDVTSEVTGIIPTILNYGDVLIQTAGERERFMFRQVSDPYAIRGLIMQLYRQNEEKTSSR